MKGQNHFYRRAGDLLSSLLADLSQQYSGLFYWRGALHNPLETDHEDDLHSDEADRFARQDGPCCLYSLNDCSRYRDEAVAAILAVSRTKTPASICAALDGKEYLDATLRLTINVVSPEKDLRRSIESLAYPGCVFRFVLPPGADLSTLSPEEARTPYDVRFAGERDGSPHAKAIATLERSIKTPTQIIRSYIELEDFLTPRVAYLSPWSEVKEIEVVCDSLEPLVASFREKVEQRMWLDEDEQRAASSSPIESPQTSSPPNADKVTNEQHTEDEIMQDLKRWPLTREALGELQGSPEDISVEKVIRYLDSAP